jgi:Flp pilus assembly pilin Flp
MDYFVQNEEGAGLVEYALLILLIALACIAAITGFGASLRGTYQFIVNSWPP